ILQKQQFNYLILALFLFSSDLWILVFKTSSGNAIGLRRKREIVTFKCTPEINVMLRIAPAA
ncbi:MAG: hypothetical protein ABJC98_10665, partial [Bacteroidota bacterium]